MTKNIEAENRQLRQQLRLLLEEARINEGKWQRLDRLEKSLIATHTLPKLIRALLEDYKNSYDTDAVTLVLSDPEYEITRTLERAEPNSSKMPGLVLLEKLYATPRRPHLGAFNPEVESAIFDPWPEGCRSMVLLPLERKGELIGSLNMASCTDERFTTDRSTDFLERLAAVFSICLENALNHERIKLVGLVDALTGAYNRRYFETRCHEEVAHARRYRQPLSCMFLDIDKFKHINDTFGHLAGDEALRHVAYLIKSQLRGNDVFARYGGEEFVVLLPRTEARQTCQIAERIRSTISIQPLQLQSETHHPITISIGVSQLADGIDGEEAGAVIIEKLLGSADGALYQAKEGGRNRVVCDGNSSQISIN
jgi:diguanylate cyclase (GGDEF)-like protein